MYDKNLTVQRCHRFGPIYIYIHMYICTLTMWDSGMQIADVDPLLYTHTIAKLCMLINVCNSDTYILHLSIYYIYTHLHECVMPTRRSLIHRVRFFIFINLFIFILQLFCRCCSILNHNINDTTITTVINVYLI